MSEDDAPSDGGGSRGDRPAGSRRATNRRAVLKAAGLGVAGLATGVSVVGRGAASGIPTPPLARCGNRLKDPNGNDVILRGVNVADPGRQLRLWRGQTADETVALALDETATAPEATEVASKGVEGWHNDVIRIPIQPQDVYAGLDNGADWNPREYMPHGDDWGPVLPGDVGDSPAPITGDTLEEYFGEIVDPLVDQIEQAGAYAMIAYHRHFTHFHQVRIDWESTDYTCSAETSESDVGGCGERGVLWHGADQADAVAANAPQNVVDAYDGVFTEDQAVAEALDSELRTYWSFVADRYADRDHVLFDVFSEPGGPYAGDWGTPSRLPYDGSDLDQDADGDPRESQVWWDLWVERAQPWIDVVEENAPGSVVTIGSPRWTQYTYWADQLEFAHDSLQMCYSAHCYVDDFALVDQFGPPSEVVPVFFDEFGWIDDDPFNYARLTGVPRREWPEFEEFVENFPVHPIASWFDHTWEPFFFTHDDAQGQGAGDWMQYIEPYQDRPGQWWMEYLASKQGMDEPEAGDGLYQCNVTDDRCYLRPEEYPEECSEYLPGVVDEETGARDLDEDGLYMDVNGNGRLDSDDVVTYFEQQDQYENAGNTSYYDYNGNERIDFDDVVTLFESL